MLPRSILETRQRGLSIRKRTVLRWRFSASAALASVCLVMPAASAESVSSRQMVCQTIEEEATTSRLPAVFLARLLWTESGFSSSATSPTGAAGVAQFMPQTAAERGLVDPRDPLESIHHAARLLVELDRHFGNLGLAAAAYNAGAARVERWLQGLSRLPMETELYVLAITGRRIEDWAAIRGSPPVDTVSYPLPGLDCLNVSAGQVTRHSALPEARLDSRVGAPTNRFAVLLHSGNLPEPAPRFRPPQPGMSLAAELLCAAIRARGGACRVFDR
jgi:hypothetical protein